jgi:hypothetical protein
MPGKDIFLSYASEDRDRIGPLVRALEGTGWTVFWDRKIPTGKTWPDVLEEEITACRSVVVVWSGKSVKSDWVQEEANEGKKRGVLFPVRIDAVDPPFGFRNIQAADLVAWDGMASAPSFQGLAKDLSVVLGKPPSKAKEAESKAESTVTSPPGVPWWTAQKVYAAVVIGLVLTSALLIFKFLPRQEPDTRPPATPTLTAEGYYSQGSARSAGGDFIGALADYTEAIRLKPDYADAYYGRAIARYHKDDFDGTLEDCSEAIRLKPDYADAYYTRGVVLNVRKDYQAALADFEKYLQLGGGRRGGNQAEVERWIRELKGKVS